MFLNGTLQPSTFFVKVGSYSSPSRRLALGLADLRKPAEPDNLTMAAEVQQVSATFYDDFGGFVSILCRPVHICVLNTGTIRALF